MEKANIATLAKATLTLEETLLLESTLEALPEDITLIFPWGSSLLSHKRSLNYLRYVMDLPPAAMQLAILRLLGLKKYRRTYFSTLSISRQERYLKHLHQRQLEREEPTGSGSTTDT